MSRGDIRLEIGELSVRGVDVVAPERLGPAIEVALAVLLRDRGVPTGSRTEAPHIVVEQPIRAEVLAERLALAVYEGLGE